MSDDTPPTKRPTGRHHRASEIHLLPPTYRQMTPEEEERAVKALAGLLAEAEARRSAPPPGP